MRSQLILSFLVCIISVSEAIKCYGANAITWQRDGTLKECFSNTQDYKVVSNQLAPLSMCWTRCAGVLGFANQCSLVRGEQNLCWNSNFRFLCPFSKSGINTMVPSLTDKLLADYYSCKCDQWRAPLPNNTCPQCNDYDTIPPLIYSYFPDASADSSRVILTDCPPDYDTCFNYCVDRVGAGLVQPVQGR